MAKQSKNRVERGYLQATGYYNKSLNPGEKMLYRAHLSWVPIFVWQIPFLLIGGIAGGVVWGVTSNFFYGAALFAIICIVGILSQLPRIWKNIGTDILLTNQGLHSKHGIVVVRDDRFTSLNRLDDSDVDFNSFFQRMFQYGDVEIKTIAGEDGFYKFKNLARPKTFKDVVRAAQTQYLNNNGDELLGMRVGNGRPRSQGTPTSKQVNMQGNRRGNDRRGR